LNQFFRHLHAGSPFSDASEDRAVLRTAANYPWAEKII
jgi:hypothetical protein